MKYIKNLSIKQKLFLVLILMTIPVIYFLTDTVLIKLNDYKKSKYLNKEITETRSISNIIHEFQKERALSLGFLVSGGKNFSQELEIQHIKTDLAIINFKDYQEADHEVFTDLKFLRNSLHKQEPELSEFEEASINIIRRLSQRVELRKEMIEDIKVRKDLNSYLNLLYAKQNLGRIRALVNKSFTLNQLTETDKVIFIEQYSLFKEHLKLFQEEATAPALEFLGKKITDQNILRVESLLNNILTNKQVDYKSPHPLILNSYFTTYIDQLKKTEDFVLNETEQDIKNLLQVNNRILICYTLFFSITFSLALFISIMIVRNISLYVSRLKIAADEVAKGNTDIDLSIHSNDELGKLADSFRSVIAKNISLSKAAGAIGEGNYTVEIEPSSEKDVLSHSLKRMQTNLRHLSATEREQSWLLKGETELNDLMRGESDIHLLAEKVIKYLCSFLNAQIGAVYLREEEKTGFKMIGGYAYPQKELLKDQGEHHYPLIEQAAKDLTPIYLNGLSTKNLVLKTGLGEIIPDSLIILPLFFKDKAIAVIEIGSKEEFSKVEKEYLDKVSEKIAVVMDHLLTEINTQQLLRETRLLAEELENQQHELKQINEELKEQSDRLQTSEEELKASQEELIQKNRELEETAKKLEDHYCIIRKKNRDLEDAHNAIEVKMKQLEITSKYKSEFLANMSHELRTPLNSIMILTKLLMENKEKNLNEKQKQFAKVIYKSGNDLLTLINDVLDLSRIESGKVKTEAAEFLIRELEIGHQFEEVAKEKEIQFNIVVDEDVPEKMVSDRFKLEQILRNFLSNAFKFTPNGGYVTLRISKNGQKTFFKNESLNNSDSLIVFSVEDSGIGISEEKQKIIFEAFEQVDASITKKYGGTGLGLSICRELTQILGGEIKVKSSGGKGSTFTLYLPEKHVCNSDVSSNIKSENEETTLVIDKEEERVFEKIENVAQHIQLKKAKNILIIEDNIEQNEAIKALLTDENFLSRSVFNGAQGLEVLEVEAFDCIIVDINLPDRDGFSLIKEIRENTLAKETPIIIYSGREISDLEEICLKKYSQAVIVKTKHSFKRLIDEVHLLSGKQRNTSSENADIEEKQNPSLALINKKVLIVDDDIRNIFALHSLLESQSMRIIAAHNGEQALKELEKNDDLDLVLMDIMMPEMDGFQVIKTIRSDQKLKTLPIIALTAKAMKADKEKCIEAGASHYLSKPLDDQILISMISDILNK